MVICICMIANKKFFCSRSNALFGDEVNAGRGFSLTVRRLMAKAPLLYNVCSKVASRQGRS